MNFQAEIHLVTRTINLLKDVTTDAQAWSDADIEEFEEQLTNLVSLAQKKRSEFAWNNVSWCKQQIGKDLTQERDAAYNEELIGKVCWVGDTLEELDSEVITRYIRDVDDSGYRVEGLGSVGDSKSWLFAKDKS